jgi:hypothetical protein
MFVRKTRAYIDEIDGKLKTSSLLKKLIMLESIYVQQNKKLEKRHFWCSKYEQFQHKIA